MSTNKAKAANATAPVREASTHGLKGFDGRSIVKAVTEAFKQSQIAGTATEAKAAAAYSVCCEANKVRKENATLDREAWSNSWRSSVRGILPQLHASGIGWVEQTETVKDGQSRIGYRLTSYGQNISSDANQVGQYDIDTEQAESLQGVRKAIKAAKEAEALEDMTDEQLECVARAGLLAESFKLLSALLADAESVEAYDLTLESMADLIEANTPIEVASDDEDDDETVVVDEDDDEEIALLMQQAS